MSDKVEQIVNDKVKQIAEDLVVLSVKDVRDLQELLKEKYGIEPYAPTVVGNVDNAGAASSAGAEKSSFTVVLKSVGASKLNVIKALKEVLGLGLAEAKAITDSIPKEIKKDVPKDEDNSLKKKLESFGAEVELK